MQGKKKPSGCTGCWRQMLLSCVLALHLIPLSVHGMVLGINATEPDNNVNTTSPVIEEDGPVKVNDVMATVTGMSTSATSAPVGSVTQRAGRMPRGDKDDAESSGMFPAPTVEKVSVAATPQIIPDSAETELLLPSNPHREDVVKGEEEGDEEEEGLPHTDPPWINVKETAMFDLDHLTTTNAPPAAATNPSNPDVLHVDFFDPSSRGRNLNLAPPSPSSLAHELQGAEATSWAMPENYDYLTTYEDGMTTTVDEYSYSTTTDAYETEEDLREAAGSPARSRPRVPGSGSFIPGGSYPGAAPNVSPNGCRVGYQLINGSCRSACEMQPNYCLNGGQCYQLDGEEIFCRCNVQDYIWHKGARCESVVTEFQVMCLAVGASALVVLLLFMIIVCFAKKLHVLKTENKKLRKRSKYRPSSEQHNDNFSLSTIAEGSHPNDDPHSQNKLEDPVKAPPKEDDSLNIHNSLTPKHENHKVLGEENSSEVTIDLELHLSKKTEFKSSGRPLAKYDVYLYRVPKAKPRVLNGPSARTANAPSRTRARVIRWEDDLYPPSPYSVCSPVSTRPLPAPVFKGLQQTKPLTIYPYKL